MTTSLYLAFFLNRPNRVRSSSAALKMESDSCLIRRFTPCRWTRRHVAADMNNHQHRCKNVESPMFRVVYSNNEPCVNTFKQLTDKLTVGAGIVDGHKACSCRWIALDRFTMICRKHPVMPHTWCPLFGKFIAYEL